MYLGWIMIGKKFLFFFVLAEDCISHESHVSTKHLKIVLPNLSEKWLTFGVFFIFLPKLGVKREHEVSWNHPIQCPASLKTLYNTL